MLNIEELKKYGADTEEALKRCMGNEAFYFKLLKMALVDQNFARLDAALENNDVKEGFEAAHALKGSTGNVSITPMFKPICALSDTLKGHTDMPLTPEHIRLAEEALEQFEKLKAL